MIDEVGTANYNPGIMTQGNLEVSDDLMLIRVTRYANLSLGQ